MSTPGKNHASVPAVASPAGAPEAAASAKDAPGATPIPASVFAPQSAQNAAAKPAPRRERMLPNIACNIVIPTVILMKLSSEKWLGPVWGLVAALAFPLGYGAWDMAARRHANVISLIGFCGVLLGGGLGLLRLDGFWFAVKEALVPSLIGVAVLVSARAGRPLVRALLCNDQLLDMPRVEAALGARGTRGAFERLLAGANRWLALTFFASAALNFCLARRLITAAPRTEEFNAQLGQMHLWSWPVIVLPSMAVLMVVLWRLLAGLQRLTGLGQDEIFRGKE